MTCQPKLYTKKFAKHSIAGVYITKESWKNIKYTASMQTYPIPKE